MSDTTSSPATTATTTATTAAPAGKAGLVARLAALLMTLGIVYGDIGTSPLYVMKAILRDAPLPEVDYIIGVLSCVIWTLTLQTTVKYVLIALRADNNGAGGILALYALVRRMRFRWLPLIAMIGAGTLIADGVITPSITVVSAIEGLRSYSPDVPVVGISLLIITLLFFVQRFGTRLIGASFGPVMFLWFLMLGVMGALHLADAPVVLKAFNPYYAFHLLFHSPEWFLIMGAVFLCTTGAEALYADLGHCGRANIRLTWTFVKTMLILNYLGQSAWIITHRAALPAGCNPFFAMMPGWFLPLGVLLATLAAIVASQALISGSFSLFGEAMNLGFWPGQKIKYPTRRKGQLYIPIINLSLYVGCVAIILAFQSSDHIEAAYGLSITVTMLMTTLLLAAWLRSRGVATVWIALLSLLFLTIEGIFLIANLFKFIHGGWVTVLIAGFISAVMFIWWRSGRIRSEHLEYVDIHPVLPIIRAIHDDPSIPQYAANLVYVSRSGQPGKIEGKTLYSIINKQPKRADHYWLLHIKITDAPDTLTYDCEQLIPGMVYRITLSMGFRVQPLISVYFRQVVADLAERGEVDLRSNYPSLRSLGIPGDFRFIVIRRVYTAGMLARHRDDLTLNLSGLIRRIATTEVRVLGLDTSNVTIEKVPLIVRRQAGVGRTVTREEDNGVEAEGLPREPEQLQPAQP